MFNATYADNLPAMEGKQQWDVVDPGFKLCAPVQNRPPCRPRKTRIRATSEGKGLGGRRKKCPRCGRLGHHGNKCKESIDPAFGEEDEHWGADNAPEHNDVLSDTDEPATTNEDDAVEETEAQADLEDDAPIPGSDAPTVASVVGTTVR